MVTWKALDAADDEETCQAIDIGSITSLYEVIKLAYIEPNDEVTFSDVPYLTGCVAYGLVAVAVDSSLFVFGESCSSLLIQITIDNVIDEIIWIPGGELLFLADRAGSLHCIHVESKELIFQKSLPILKCSDIGCLFICGKCFIAHDGLLTIVLITSFGQIIRVENIDKDALLEGLRMRDMPFLNSLKSQIKLKIDHIFEEDSDALALCADCVTVTGSSKFWIWIGMRDGVYFWNSESLHSMQPQMFLLTSCSSCSKLVPILQGQYVAAVNETGALSVISSQMGLILWESSLVPEREFFITDIYELSSDMNTCQLLLLATSADKTNNFLLILSIPSFDIKYEVAVRKGTCLLGLGDDVDSIMFMEPELSDGNIRSLKLKSIVDGQPDARLAKLLQKHKFDDAEEFCGTFGLDVEEVHKAKSCFLRDLINPFGILSSNTTITDPGCISRHFEDLLQTLDRIKDNEFITTLCVEARLLDICTTEKLLSFAKDRLASASQNETGNSLSALMQRVSKNLYCLQTFQIIFPTSEVYHWLAFSRTNMLEEFIEHLARGYLDVASTIWHRHQYEFFSFINEKCVNRILATIPVTIPSEKLCSWLPKNLLIDFVKFCPSSIELIAAWADERIRQLESFEKTHWPSNGYSLATATIDALESVASDFYTGGYTEIQMAVHAALWTAHSPSSSLGHLRQMAIALKDMQILADKFVIKIKYSQYTQECKTSVVATLLDWLVSGEEVAPLMEGFLRAYMIRHELDCDKTLSGYILETLASSDHEWWLFEEAPWEDKLYSVINSITDAQIQAHCIVECVCLAPVPWSEGTRKMCALGMSLNTPYTSSLDLQERLSKLKIVLRRHELHRIHFSNGENSEFILHSITSHDGENIPSDAAVVVSALDNLDTADAFFFRLCHLMSKEKYDEVKELLCNLEQQARITACSKFIQYVIQQLSRKSLNIKTHEQLKRLTSGVVALEHTFKVYCPKLSLEEKFWSDLRRINALQVKFNLFPTLDELETPTACATMLKQYIVQLYTQKQKTDNRQDMVSSLSRTCHVSQITQTTHCTAVLTSSHRMCETTVNCTKEMHDADHESSVPWLWEEMEKLQYFSWLLGHSRQDFLTILGSEAMQNGLPEEALAVTKLIASDRSVKSFTPVVYKVVQMIVNEWKANGTDKFKKVGEESSKLYKRIFITVTRKLLSSAEASCDADDIALLTELSHWCHISDSLYDQCHYGDIYANSQRGTTDDPFLHWKFSPVFCDPGMPIEEDVVTNAVSNILEDNVTAYTQMNETSRLPYFSTANVSTIYRDKATDLTGHLKDRNHDLLALLVSQSMYMHHRLIFGISHGTDVNYPYEDNFAHQVTTLLLKVVSSDNKDLTFAVSLLIQLPIKDALKVLKDVKRRLDYDFARLQLVGYIGQDYCLLCGLHDISLQFVDLSQRASWGKRLEEMGIAFKSGFSGDKLGLRQVLKQMVSHSKCSFTLLYEFCDTFTWDVTEALSHYLIFCIKSWSPTVNENSSSVKDIIRDVPYSLSNKICCIVSKFENKQALRQTLEEEFNNISSYNYEMLEIVLTHLSSVYVEAEAISIMRRGKDILQFLQVYQRQNLSGETEREEWFTAHPDSNDLPTISKYRLPFHELYGKGKTVMIKVVEQELNVHTVERWVQIAEPLKMNNDQMYFMAAEKTVSDILKKEGFSRREWQLCSANSALLAEIQNIISNIKHPELATACANRIVTSLPPGADKVEAAKKCSLLASYYKTAYSDPKIADVCMKFEKRYQHLALEHTLHKFELAESEYLSLTDDPENLIFKLYDHPCLSSPVKLGAEELPDINGCITELCKVAHCDQTSIQFDLLCQWFPAMDNEQHCNHDETVSNFKLLLDQGCLQDEPVMQDNSLSRVIYLLRCLPQKQAISYLTDQAFGTDENLSTTVKLKALRCLLAIADRETIQEHTVLTLDDIRTMLQSVIYVSRLESLGHATVLSKFKTMDKNALVEGLWRSHRHKTEALLLLIDLCCDFEISTASLWGAVLAQITSLAEMEKLNICVLEKVLLKIKNIPYLWLLPQLASAWELVIYNPFKKAHLPLSHESLNSCVHSINLLVQYCPVIIPTESLVSLCDSLQLPVLKLAVLASKPSYDQYIQPFLESVPREILKAQYEKVKLKLVLSKFVEDLISSL